MALCKRGAPTQRGGARVKKFRIRCDEWEWKWNEGKVASREEKEEDFPTLTLESSDDAHNPDPNVEEDTVPDDWDDEDDSSEEEEEAVEVEAASLERELEVADSHLSPADLKLISNFFEWLQSIDGGLKSQGTAVLYRKAAKMILSNLGGLKSLKRYADLGRDGGYFQGLIEKRVAPGTVKSFLMGMQAFASYLQLHTYGILLMKPSQWNVPPRDGMHPHLNVA